MMLLSLKCSCKPSRAQQELELFFGRNFEKPLTYDSTSERKLLGVMKTVMERESITQMVLNGEGGLKTGLSYNFKSR